jgi:O-antigen ligase
VQPDDPVDSPHYTSINRYLRLAFGKLGISLDLDDGEQREEQTTFVEIEEDRDVSNGRLFVWKNFMQRMNIRGHYPGHIVLDGDWVIYHAHNTYFQNMFQFGVPVGILFGLLILLTYVYAAVSFAKKRNGSFAMLALGNMMVGMLTEWSGHPAYPFGMFLLLAFSCLVFTKNADEKVKDKADGSGKVAE